MSNSKSSNKVSVPEAKEAMNRFQTGSGIRTWSTFKRGLQRRSDIRQAGSIGGEMVKKMIMRQEEQMSDK